MEKALRNVPASQSRTCRRRARRFAPKAARQPPAARERLRSSRRLLKQFNPDVLFFTGGYALSQWRSLGCGGVSCSSGSRYRTRARAQGVVLGLRQSHCAQRGRLGSYETSGENHGDRLPVKRRPQEMDESRRAGACISALTPNVRTILFPGGAAERGQSTRRSWKSPGNWSASIR